MAANKIATGIYRWLQSDRIAWLAQVKLRDSFLSKALTSLSLATFALGNFAPLLIHLGVHIWRLQCLFIGSVLFLMGYLVVTFRIPPEFRGASKLNEIVEQMLTLKDRHFFESRRQMTNFLVQRLEKSRPFDLGDGILQYAKRNTVLRLIPDKAENWEAHAPSLYHADVVLRQYDRPWSRLCALIFMGGGILLLLIPTFDGFLHAVLGQLPR